MGERRRRRLAVILHADVVGSTTLVQQDEALAHERIRDAFRRFAETIKAYGGLTLELRGDALLAEFDRASDAVCSSLAFLAGNAEFNATLENAIRPDLRVGIAMGEVVVADRTVTGLGVVLAQRLEQLAEPGGVCIQGAAYETIPQRLPFAYEFLGEQMVKGVDTPVRAHSVALAPGQEVPAPERSSRPGRWRLAVAIVSLALVVAGGLAWMRPWLPSEEPASLEQMALPSSDKPSIAVLPFVNMSDDTRQDYFVDGLTEDLITDLAQLSGLIVISRNSVFTYKNRAVKIQDVARELGVRYVLEGSVRRAADRIRITAQLLDAETDQHLWADRYDRVLDDVFAVQDEVKQQIVTSLTLQLDTGEVQQLSKQPTSNLEAYEYYLRGRKAMYQETSRNIRLAYFALEKAIELDPGFAQAQAALAMNYAIDYGGTQYSDTWVRPPSRSRTQALQLAERAEALDPNIALSHLALAEMNLIDRDFDGALAQVDEAMKIQTGDSQVFEARATVLTARGDHREALDAMEHAFRLDPKPPSHYYGTLGKIQFALRDYKQAAENLEKAAAGSVAGYTWRNSYYLPAAYAYLGLRDEARELLADGTDIFAPGFSLEAARLHPIYEQQSDIDHYLEGLRRAGVPRYPFGFNPERDAGAPVDTSILQNWLAGSSFDISNLDDPVASGLTFRGDGTATLQYRHDLSGTGTVSLASNDLCFNFEDLTHGRTACFRVFHNPDPANTELKAFEFVMAGFRVWYLYRR